VRVVAAVLVWQWRPHRGPVMVRALAIGRRRRRARRGVGALIVRSRYGRHRHRRCAGLDRASRVIRDEAPAVFFAHHRCRSRHRCCSRCVAALVYALMAVSTQRDDLGAWPP
jgi:hypothetical protein